MKLAIAYSHADIRLALKLLLWIRHLGGVGVPLLVVATKRASRTLEHQRIAQLLREEFPGHEHKVCLTEDERGWPRSSSHLFAETLRFAKDDMFWLEPDCVPMKRGWFDRLHKAYRKAGKTFMGAYVPTCSNVDQPHMSGVAFYGKNWEKVAPCLGFVQDRKMGAWDVDCAPQVLTDFAQTDLIQHSWVRYQADRRVMLGDVAPITEVYHQCKDGDLFAQIDPSFLSASLTQRFVPVTTGNSMPHYFLSENAKTPVILAGKKFEFDPCMFFQATNSWWGTLVLTDATEVDLMLNAVASGRVQEITEEDYLKYQSKKKSASVPRLSITLRSPLDNLQPQANALPAGVVPAAPPKPTATLDAVTTPRPTRRK